MKLFSCLLTWPEPVRSLWWSEDMCCWMLLQISINTSKMIELHGFPSFSVCVCVCVCVCARAHLWSVLSCPRRFLCLSDENPERCVGRLLLALLLVAGAHRREPAAAQLGLIREPESEKIRSKNILDSVQLWQSALHILKPQIVCVCVWFWKW